MNSKLKLLIAVCILGSVGALAIDKIQTMEWPAKQSVNNVVESKLNGKWSYDLKSENGVKADFTVKEDGEAESYWSENFDAGVDNWTLDSTNPSTTIWTHDASIGDAYNFSSIDPNNVASLVVSAYYRYPKETTNATSPAVTVADNSTLTFYVGYSINYSSYCTTSLLISDDNGVSWKSIWKSTDLPDDYKPFKWHKVENSMLDYAGKSVKMRWQFYGYMGEIYLDGISLSSPKAVSSVSRLTGEPVELVNTSENAVSYLWNMPGATPSTSTDVNPTVYYTRPGSYDISLTATSSDGKSASVTKQAAVVVESVAPVAKIGTPTDILEWTTKLPFVAPFESVKYTDKSTGFPTSLTWGFSGVDADGTKSTVIEDVESPEVNYMFMNTQKVLLIAQNDKGISQDEKSVYVKYSGLVSNVQNNDVPTTFDLGDGFGFFPGTNKLKISAYAEYFSKPARPALFYGVNLYFTKIEATELYEQLQSVNVYLCKNDNGVPGEKIDFASWCIYELEAADGTAVPTTFEFTKPVVVDSDFFIVIDGLPEYSDVVDVRIAMAKFRDHDNTAYLKTRDGWRTAASYFPAGANHTSYYVTPALAYWAFSFMNDGPLVVGKAAGTVNLEVYSTLGYETPIKIDADWCKVTSEPNGLTLDDITIAYEQLPAGVSSRVATITLSNGYETKSITLTQSETGGVSMTENVVPYTATVTQSSINVNVNDNVKCVDVWNMQGQLMKSVNVAEPQTVQIPCDSWTKGTYILRVQAVDNVYCKKMVIK